MAKKVVVKPLPKVGVAPETKEKIGKFFLESARVRAILFTSLPTLVLVLKSLGIYADQDALQHLIESVFALIGALGGLYNIFVSYEKGDIRFVK